MIKNLFSLEFLKFTAVNHKLSLSPSDVLFYPLHLTLLNISGYHCRKRTGPDLKVLPDIFVFCSKMPHSCNAERKMAGILCKISNNKNMKAKFLLAPLCC